MSGRVWSGAALASVLLHGAGLDAIALSTDPEDAPDQNIPKSQFSIEAAEVPRSRAAPQTPAGDPAAEAQAKTAAAQSGNVPTSRASAATPQMQQLAARAAPAPTLLANDAAGTRQNAAAPETSRLGPSTAPVERKSPARLPASILSPSATPETPAVVASAPVAPLKVAALANTPAQVSAAIVATPPALRPTSPTNAPALAAVTASVPRQTALSPPTTPAALAATTGRRATPAQPASAPAPRAEPQPANSAALPLPATAGTAALAWSGEDTTAVSETSLAAITAFTQVGDLAAASAQVRDGIAGILAAVPCARLQTTFLPDTGQLELRGHIPEEGLRAPVLAALQEQIGAAIDLSDQLLILPRPQCGALAGIANVGLPQSTEQLSDPAVIGEDGFARTYTYVDGERLRLDLMAPDYDSYIYVDYFVADGSVIHLQPNDIFPLEFAQAKSEQSVGRARADKPFLELIVSAPYGQEIAAAFASSVPLYEGTRPLQEPAEAYLAFLKEQVARARAEHPDFKGEWVYFFISTRAP